MAKVFDIDVKLLMTLIELRPVLWDKTLEIYKDKVLTKKAWTNICKDINSDFDSLSYREKNEFNKQVMKKWWNLRDGFIRSLKKQKEASKSGAGGSKVKKYVYNDQLQFLLKLTDGRETADNLLHEDYIPKEEVDADVSEDLTDEEATPRKLCSRKRKLDPMELKMMQLIEESENRHISFFKGIIPSLNNFDEDDVIQFQMGVLQLISDIKQQKLIKQSTTPVQQSNLKLE